eukprot:tig00000367_g24455.t1
MAPSPKSTAPLRPAPQPVAPARLLSASFKHVRMVTAAPGEANLTPSEALRVLLDRAHPASYKCPSGQSLVPRPRPRPPPGPGPSPNGVRLPQVARYLDIDATLAGPVDHDDEIVAFYSDRAACCPPGAETAIYRGGVSKAGARLACHGRGWEEDVPGSLATPAPAPPVKAAPPPAHPARPAGWDAEAHEGRAPRLRAGVFRAYALDSDGGRCDEAAAWGGGDAAAAGLSELLADCPGWDGALEGEALGVDAEEAAGLAMAWPLDPLDLFL